MGLTITPNTISYPGKSSGEFRNTSAFAAIKADGSVVTWGDSYYGGYSSDVASELNGAVDVKQIYSTGYAFAAVREDGSVVTWGSSYSGGDSSSVAGELISGVVSMANPYTDDVYIADTPSFDTTAPTATITLSKNSLTIGQTATVSIKFSEKVTGFDNSDLSVIGGKLSNLSTTDNIT